MRTEIKPAEYWPKFIEFQAESVAILLRDYDERKTTWTDETIKGNFRNVFHYAYHKFIAQYSSGASVDEVIKSYRESIEYMVREWDRVGGYVQMVWMLSLGVLFKIDDVAFNKLVALVERDGLQDVLVDFLISYCTGHPRISASLEFDVPYKFIANATKLSKDAAPAQVKEYLEKKWYRGHSDSYWHDNHKNKNDIYFGYWSFESAAVTAILALDDSAYKTNKYYPADLVEFFRRS